MKKRILLPLPVQLPNLYELVLQLFLQDLQLRLPHQFLLAVLQRVLAPQRLHSAPALWPFVEAASI